MVTEGIIAPHELPAGWGMLVQRDGALTLKRRPVFLPVEEPVRVQFLHAIAIAGTRYCRRAMNDAKV